MFLSVVIQNKNIAVTLFQWEPNFSGGLSVAFLGSWSSCNETCGWHFLGQIFALLANIWKIPIQCLGNSIMKK